jgi:hypothetical protein
VLETLVVDQSTTKFLQYSILVMFLKLVNFFFANNFLKRATRSQLVYTLYGQGYGAIKTWECEAALPELYDLLLPNEISDLNNFNTATDFSQTFTTLKEEEASCKIQSNFICTKRRKYNHKYLR